MIVTLLVDVNVLNAHDDSKFVSVQKAREVAKAAIQEALEHAESRGFNGSDDYCIALGAVEVRNYQED